MIASLLIAGLQSAPLDPAALTELHARRAAAAADVQQSLAAVADASDEAAVAALLRCADGVALSDLGASVSSHLRAAAAFAPAFAPPAAARDYLRRALVDVGQNLAFRPVAEAPVPAGFPDFTPAGEMLLLEYPAVRLARVPMSRSGNGAFWSLFLHIQGADIAMTAPVQMDYAAGAQNGAAEPASMGFLYDLPERGPAGNFGKVEVLDQPAVTVLSIGQRGWVEVEQIEALDRMLRDRLAAEYPDWEVAGALRVQEYNSPSVRGTRRFFEVQLPVRRILAAAAATE